MRSSSWTKTGITEKIKPIIIAFLKVGASYSHEDPTSYCFEYKEMRIAYSKNGSRVFAHSDLPLIAIDYNTFDAYAILHAFEFINTYRVRTKNEVNDTTPILKIKNTKKWIFSTGMFCNIELQERNETDIKIFKENLEALNFNAIMVEKLPSNYDYDTFDRT